MRSSYEYYLSLSTEDEDDILGDIQHGGSPSYSLHLHFLPLYRHSNTNVRIVHISVMQ